MPSYRTSLSAVLMLLLGGAGTLVVTAQNSTNSSSVPAPTSSPVTGAASKCPMTCSNGGVCKVGTADFSMQPVAANGAPFTFLAETSREGWFCECPEGFTGIRCGRPVVACPDADNTTGPLYCYHGGQCVEGLGNSTTVAENQRFCDCSAAEYNGVFYFGKYCEIEGARECAPGSDVFCTAQGTCKDDFESKAHPCECRDGYRGPHCEFLRGQVPDCVLECQNGGECTLGVKDFETAKYQEFWLTHDGNYQHCVSIPARYCCAWFVTWVLLSVWLYGDKRYIIFLERASRCRLISFDPHGCTHRICFTF
jgi:hypothetical protein